MSNIIVKQQEWIHDGDLIKLMSTWHIYNKGYVLPIEKVKHGALRGKIVNINMGNSQTGSIKISKGVKIQVLSTTMIVEDVLRNPKIEIYE